MQLRYTTTLANIAEAAGFTGDEFNDQTAGVLHGIASALGLDANLTITGDLAVSLVFGVDSGGFYVSPETSLRLTVAANGSVAGTATLSGATGVSVSGTGDANLTVTMQLGSRAARRRSRRRSAHVAAPTCNRSRAPAAHRDARSVGTHVVEHAHRRRPTERTPRTRRPPPSTDR